MDQNNQNNPANTPEPVDEADSLEVNPTGQALPNDPGGQLEGVAPEPTTLGSQPTTKSTTNTGFKLKSLLKRFNVYLLIFLLLIMVAIAIVVILALSARNANKTTTVNSQSLSDSTLKQLANSDASVGDPKQVLNVQSNAVFAGKVLVRQGIDIGGALTVSGALNIAAISVSGTGTFDQLQANSLAIVNNATIQGELSVQKTLSVNGSGNFTGPVTAPVINTDNLQLNGDLSTTRHITAGGTAPSKSDGPALGGGGTTSVSGSDTAGSISVNTGGNTTAGCFVTLTFAQKFNSTPHVVITPIGAAAGGINYYVNRSTTSFSVCAATPAATGQTFGFDYFIVD